MPLIEAVGVEYAGAENGHILHHDKVAWDVSHDLRIRTARTSLRFPRLSNVNRLGYTLQCLRIVPGRL